MLGLGPGPHLEVPAIIVAARKEAVEPKYVEHPELNGTPNFEAHNTFLDVFMQGGLLAILSLIGLIATAFLFAYRARLDALAAMMCGLVVMCTFHLIIRHPLFWFAITLCLVAATDMRNPSTVRNGRK
jgi:O-antigen ligase